ncbi:MAG: hypothetical protein K1X29_10375 [Bdellovibrionales bacterium]|nr:hypothetical protein [Bdellovibrionales bacterium]
MTLKTVFSGLLLSLSCYLFLGVIATLCTLYWLLHILPQNSPIKEMDKTTVVKKFGDFLASEKKESIDLQVKAHLKTEPAGNQQIIDFTPADFREFESDENLHEVVKEVQSCLRGINNNLLTAVLILNYPRERWTETEYDESQKLISQVRHQWSQIRETFGLAIIKMEGDENCEVQRQVLKEVVASIQEKEEP